MDMHVRTVGVLHVVYAALTLAVIALLALFFSASVALAQAEWPDIAGFAGFGAVLAVSFVVIAVAQVVAATHLLGGSVSARSRILVFGVLALLNFPLGTALGVYTLWVLLRQTPVPPALPGVAGV